MHCQICDVDAPLNWVRPTTWLRLDSRTSPGLIYPHTGANRPHLGRKPIGRRSGTQYRLGQFGGFPYLQVMSQFRGTVRSAEDEEFSPLRPGSPSAAQIFEFNNFAGGRPPNPSESLRARSISRDTKRRAMAKEGTEGDEEMEPSEAARQSHSAEPPGHGVITGYDNRSGAFDKFVGSSRNFENGGVVNPALLTTVQINNGVVNPALADDEDDGWKHAILMEIDEEPNQHSQGTRTDQEQFDPRTRTEYAQQEQHMGHPGSEQQQAEWWYLHGQEASRLEQSAANFRTEQPDRYGFGQPRMHQQTLLSGLHQKQTMTSQPVVPLTNGFVDNVSSQENASIRKPSTRKLG